MLAVGRSFGQPSGYRRDRGVTERHRQSRQMTAMWDPLSDSRPLISAAASGKFRLVRLLLEGGAQVNGCNQEGDTALLAACKALRGEPAGLERVKLLTYLLQNKADPNAQDRFGRTALMYSCMERAGPQVVSTLLAAGADPSMEDQSGASALVYAINAQHQPTLQVLMDDCQAHGRDIIIIATETGVHGGPVTRRYLNVVPSPDSSPVSCMSPSDIILKTGSPGSPKGENIFNFRGPAGQGRSSVTRRPPSCELSPLSHPPAPRQRVLSEPWITIGNLASLQRAYEEGVKQRSMENEQEKEDSKREDGEEPYFYEERKGKGDNSSPRASQSPLSLPDITSSQTFIRRLFQERTGGSTHDKRFEKIPNCPSPSSLRRNTHPSVMVVPPPLPPPTFTCPIPFSPAGFSFQKQVHGVPASSPQLLSTLLSFSQSSCETSSTAGRLLRHLLGCGSCFLRQQAVNASTLGAA